VLVAALDPLDRRQLAEALDLLARRLRADGLQPTAAVRALRVAWADSRRQNLRWWAASAMMTW